MSQGIEVAKSILPVVIMLAVGMIFRKKKLISREGIDGLKNVAVNVALPAVMLNAFATMTYTLDNIVITVLMFAVCLAAWFLGKVLGKALRLESPFVAFLTTGFEAGMLGYALYTMLYGADSIGTFACIDLGQVLFVFTLYKILIGVNKSEKTSAGQLAADMIHSPTVIAILAGILLGATGLYEALQPSGISGLIDACTDFISAPTSAIILLTIGYDLVLGDIPWLSAMKAVGLRIGILLVLRVLLGTVFGALGFGDTFNHALNVMFILPPPYVLPVFADDENQRTYISSAISVSTIAAMIGFVVLAVLA